MKTLLEGIIEAFINEEPMKAVKKDTNRVVVYTNKDNYDDAIKQGTHRPFNPATDKDLPMDGEPTGGEEPGDQTTTQDIDKMVDKAKAAGELPSEPSPEDAVKLSAISSRNHRQRLDTLSKLQTVSEDNVERNELFVKFWEEFLDAGSYEEQVQAVRNLAEYGFIEGHAGKKKIYLKNVDGVGYKYMSANGDSITEAMNNIIEKENIEVPMRGSSSDRALADMSGKQNEAGVVFHLDGSEQNQIDYEETLSRFSELGGNRARADEMNVEAARLIEESLPEGSKIIRAMQTGGIGRNALMKLGIDPKVDPTDIIVEYQDPQGTTHLMKISAKIYSDPKNITMKNSGVSNAGVTYLGESLGASLDADWPEIREKYKWDSSMSDEEISTRKLQLKKEYLSRFAERMVELSQTEEGQQQLLKIWRDVHGCGNDVHTLIVHKKTGKSQLKSPEYYCEPDIPLSVNYDGTKVVIDMNTEGPQSIQIDLKTETNSSPKLLFRHKIKPQQKESAPPELRKLIRDIVLWKLGKYGN